MRTFLTDRKEIETALRAPRSSVYCVTTDKATYPIDQVRQRQGILQVHIQRGDWTRQIISIYREV
jgi:hypothetical protein